ncbi:MAG: hypothetical protein C0468_05370 [Planctomyces sp.]|nr:hypothetical protein [Planctomyces sp.]
MGLLTLMFDSDGVWFTVPALVATGVFMIKLLAGVSGLGGMEELETGMEALDMSDADSVAAFKWLSVQGVAAFVMGFGWGGLAALKGSGLELVPSVAVGVAVGVGMVWLLAWCMKLVHDLSVSGNISKEMAVGLEGDVYVTVPVVGGGAGGKVRVVIKERQRIYDAVSEGPEIGVGTRVRVVRANEDQSVTVRPA